jgi:phage terminase Nu1 subunit (DNA packaging protein)
MEAWIKAGMPIATKARGNKPALYDVFSCCRWWLEKERSAAGDEDGRDYAYWRTVREHENAIRARRRNEREAGLLVPRTKTEQELALASQLLREGLETVGHRFGSEAAEMINSVLDAQETAWESALRRAAGESNGDSRPESRQEPGQHRVGLDPALSPPQPSRIRRKRNRPPPRQPARRGKVPR